MKSNNIRDSPPPLRDYQQADLAKMQNYEGRAALMVLATGLGKTRIYTEYIRWDVLNNNHNCLILSHREELVYQPLTYLRDLPCGVELAEKYAHGEPVISASVQSLVGRLDKYNPYEIDTIIVDEAHHAAAPTYRRVLEYFSSAQIFGFTGTAHRGDGVGLSCVFDDILTERDTLWGIDNGYLLPMECCQVTLKYDMGSVKIEEDGDYNQADIARVMSGTAAGVVEAYRKYARGPTIIFGASVDEVKDITALLNKKYGRSVAVAVTANTPNRSQILEAFRLGIIKVIVNFGIFTEGTDLPMIETVLIARPVAPTNVGLYAQMVGRGLRLYPGKTSCMVIDCVGISDNPICTAASLIGKDVPTPKPEKAKQEKIEDEEEKIEVLRGSEIPDTWIKKELEVDIVEKGVGFDLHDVAWIKLENGGYLLQIPGVTYRISKPLIDGNVYLHKNKICSKMPMPTQFILDWVYQDLKQKHANVSYLWNKSERRRWDNQLVSSEQISLIKRLAPDYKINPKKMTRGDASCIIQNLLHVQKSEGENDA